MKCRDEFEVASMRCIIFAICGVETVCSGADLMLAQVRAQEDLALIVTGFPLELPAFSPLRLPPHSASTHDLSWVTLSSPLTLKAPLHGVGITCVGGFSKPSHSTGEELTLHLSFSSMMPCAFKASCLELAFSDARFDKTLGEKDAEVTLQIANHSLLIIHRHS